MSFQKTILMIFEYLLLEHSACHMVRRACHMVRRSFMLEPCIFYKLLFTSSYANVKLAIILLN